MPFDVRDHYNCQISDVTTNHDRITPTWHRVSQSPWGAKSSKTAGYGRPIIRCAVSDDMPLNFVRTEHIKRPEDIKALPKQDFSSTSSIQASLLLPGAGSTLASKPKHGNRIRKLHCGNQVLVEAVPTPRDTARCFHWNSKEGSPAGAAWSGSSRGSSGRWGVEGVSPVGTARSTSRGASSRPASSQAAFPSSRVASGRSSGRRLASGSSNRDRAALFSR